VCIKKQLSYALLHFWLRIMSEIFRSIKWDPSPAICLQSWPILSESRSVHTVEKWMYLRILIPVGCVKLLPIEQNNKHIDYFKIYSVNSLCAVIFWSIGNNFTQPTWINILRYIHFSTVRSERDSLKMGQLWRQIAGLGSHLIDLKIWDMVLSQ
jgi:hypothetical protein